MCFDTVIRSNVKLREAAGSGRPIVRYAKSANGAIDYGALAAEVEALGLAEQATTLGAALDEAARAP